jgi:hypothetical protein
MSYLEAHEKFSELEALYKEMCENMETLCDFASSSESKIKQEYLILKDWILNHDVEEDEYDL